MRIERGQVQRVSKNCKAVIHGAAAGPRIRRHHVSVNPEDASGFCIQSHNIAWRLGEIHDSVHDQRRGFEFLQRVGLENPLLLEILHVDGSDLFQQAVTLACVTTRIRQPVFRMIGGVKQEIVCDLSVQDGNQQTRKEHGSQQAFLQELHFSYLAPFKVRMYVTTSSSSIGVRVFLKDGMVEALSTVYSFRSDLSSDTSRSSLSII